MTLFLILFCLVVAIGLGCLAAWSDFKGLQIANIYPGGIALSFLVAYAAFYFLAPESGYFSGPVPHLVAFALLFAVSFVLFSLKMIGAGDSKLLSVYALWAGFGGLLPFLFYMALIGGVLGGFSLWVQRAKPFEKAAADSWIGRLQAGQSAVPYGIAITGGAIVCFVFQGYVSPENMRLLAMAGG